MESNYPDERGREARKPNEIPKKGWKDVLLRTKEQITVDNVDIVSAGVAFYSLLSIPFVLTALVSIYGLVADPSQVQQQMASLQGVVPVEAQSLLSEQLTNISSKPSGSLTLTLVGSILLALWSGSKAVKSLITALNIAYDEREKRGFLKLNFSAVLLTLASIVGVIAAMVLVVGIPAVIDQIGLSRVGKTLSTVLRWPLLASFVLLGLACIYRYGPSREKAQWKWVTWGSVFATGLWLIGSALFSLYVSSFAKYNETYGSLGAVVVMLMWFYVSTFIVMLGAELNSEMEHQTKKDTTTGEPVPMGQRGAVMADTLGEAREKRAKKRGAA